MNNKQSNRDIYIGEVIDDIVTTLIDIKKNIKDYEKHTIITNNIFNELMANHPDIMKKYIKPETNIRDNTSIERDTDTKTNEEMSE